MITREELKEGETYAREGDKLLRTIRFIGDSRLFYSRNDGQEFSDDIEEFTKLHIPLPKPKKKIKVFQILHEMTGMIYSVDPSIYKINIGYKKLSEYELEVDDV